MSLKEQFYGYLKESNIDVNGLTQKEDMNQHTFHLLANYNSDLYEVMFTFYHKDIYLVDLHVKHPLIVNDLPKNDLLEYINMLNTQQIGDTYFLREDGVYNKTYLVTDDFEIAYDIMQGLLQRTASVFDGYTIGTLTSNLIQ